MCCVAVYERFGEHKVFLGEEQVLQVIRLAVRTFAFCLQ